MVVSSSLFTCTNFPGYPFDLYHTDNILQPTYKLIQMKRSRCLHLFSLRNNLTIFIANPCLLSFGRFGQCMVSQISTFFSSKFNRHTKKCASTKSNSGMDIVEHSTGLPMKFFIESLSLLRYFCLSRFSYPANCYRYQKA